MSRLAGGGLVDRARPLGFEFDGRQYQGLQGDTLASALIANDVRLVGRSFKYHRPRGILTAGSEEPNALLTLGRGARAEPNTRATMIELFDGLVASSQNRWPSLGLDLLAVNQLFAPLLTAGFYYKTFMWPSAFWEKVYEPLIRRSAGLGALSKLADPDSYDRTHGFCDLLVIGAGPAGLAAALVAARAGARVILADEDSRMGGRLLAERYEIGGEAGHDWASGIVSELASLPNVRLLPRTSVFGVYDGREYGACERLTDHLGTSPSAQPRQRYWKILAKHALLASGAIERPLIFGGNDRPGVMMASAISTYLNRYAVVAGRRVVLFSSSDSGWQTAEDLVSAGIEVAAVVDARSEENAAVARLRKMGVETFAGAVVTDVTGRTARGVTVRDASNRMHHIKCDLLGMSGGWNPAIGLAGHLGAAPVWSEAHSAFIASHLPSGMMVIGAANGSYALGAALTEGFAAGSAIAAELGLGNLGFDVPSTSEDRCSARAIWLIAGSRGKAFADFQNDVTDEDVRQAAREGFTSIEHMKRYTTLGMATDQGRVGQLGGQAILADALGKTIAEAGTIRARPPSQPVPLAALAGYRPDGEYRPVRRIAAHGWAKEQGAVFTDAGQWQRPQWFARPGEAGWLDTVNREVLGVRNGVGVCDVSTLGKIDVQGSDAGRFLDHLYINSFSRLPVGKARYGVMLRDDGFVLDDGTTTRLAEDRFFVTTTTARAALVMQHIDYCRQVLWPGLDVQAVSVTEQWTTYAVAGPRSRALLEALLPDVDLSNEAFPFMAAIEGRWHDLPLRLIRLSFSGELAYEISVPAYAGDRLIRALFVAGTPLGVMPYGTEALGVLRIEKGHVGTGELNGQTTAIDLGFGRMMSTSKDFIGRIMAARPGLIDPSRPALVGLKPLDPRQMIRAGAHLLPSGAPGKAAHAQGHVTSAAWSPNLRHSIALALLRHGRERHGERITVHDPLRGAPIDVEVCPPVFIDPQGERVRG